jgi:DNA invertase Pin-like site-specific DNA recombinase
MQSTELQRREIEGFLQGKGFREIVFFEDKQTGTNANRPRLQEMLSRVRRGDIGVVIVWKLDRLFRSLKDLVNTLHEFSENGTSFISVKDNLDFTTSTGRLMVNILGAFAQFEADLIRSRVIAGLANARAMGKVLGRRPSIPRDVVRELRLQGLSLSQIASKIGVTKSGVSKTLSSLGLKAGLTRH